MLIDDFLIAPKDDGFVMMTQQSDYCHNNAKDTDECALRQRTNFLTVNSARRRKNNQNRVSWHNSYAQRGADDNSPGELNSAEIDSSSLEGTTLNFRSMAMADVGADATVTQRTITDSDSASSPSLFIIPPVHNSSEQENETVESQKSLFSAPIAKRDVFSFDNGARATSAELLPSIDEIPPGKSTHNTSLDWLPPEPLSNAPDSAVPQKNSADGCLTPSSFFSVADRDGQRRRSVSYINSFTTTTTTMTATTTDDNTSVSSSAFARENDSDADVQHKRSASDHVIASTTFGEDFPSAIPSTSAQVASQTDSHDFENEAIEKKSSFIEVSSIDSRLSTSTPSINENVRLSRDNSLEGSISISSSKNIPFLSSLAQTSTFNSNHQYKLALLNSAAEARSRNGPEIDSNSDATYPHNISPNTISNGTNFFKSGSLRKSLRKGKSESEEGCEISQQLQIDNNISNGSKKAEKPGRGGVSISNLVDRFTSRRQHSDGNLRRLFANAQNSSSSSKCCTHSPMTSSLANEDKTNTSRRSFKWRSFFSTHKANSITGNKENWNISNQLNSGGCNVTKNRLKKSISLSYAAPAINLPAKSRTLTPLLEDNSPVSDSYDASVRFRASAKTDPSEDKKADNPRPFSVIGSTEHDSKIILQRYKIDEVNDRKFMEFLRLHEIDPNKTLQSSTFDSSEMTRSSFVNDSISVAYCETNICFCALSSSANVEIIDDLNVSMEMCVGDTINATDTSDERCPKHGIRRRNSSEKQTPVGGNLPQANYQSLSAQSNYYSLSRRRPRRMIPYNGGGTLSRVRRRQSINTNTPGGTKLKRPFSPPSSSPSHSNNSAQSNTRGTLIQKRRVANRRRSSINVNQVLTAIQIHQERHKLRENCDDNNVIEEVVKDAADNCSSELSNANVSNNDPSFDESAGRDALKAIIMRQHSIKQATKSETEGLKWRKTERSVEKEKKRESKTNSVILGTLLSIRQKKKPKDTRNLANVFPFHPVNPAAVASGASVYRKESSPGFLDNRRSAHLIFSESKGGLPDVLNSVLSGAGTVKEGHNVASLTSSISPGAETPPQSFQFDDAVSSFPLPRLVKQKWEDLDLWADEPGTWSSKHPDVNLPAAEKKRQNVIYEIYITEKHHCQVIVFLQQAYQAGLLNSGIMTMAEIKKLIPDVLDSLLDFHLRLLRRIRERVHSSKTVSTISDIIFEEFEEGDYRNAAINAYTNFCLARDDAHKVYAFHMERNPSFKKFFDHYERDPEYKGRNFKSCLLLIAQRLTKYPLLIEQILKLDSPTNKSMSQRAHNAVKSFALKVDSELWLYELNRRWENLKKNMDKSSVGQLLGAPFTYDDLVHQTPEDPRKLLSISTVHWQSVTGQKIELSIVIFDDIVAFLHERNGIMQFFSQKDHASVIPLHTALIREMERTNEVMLIVLVKKKPDMYRLVFNNKTEMHNWISTFKKARLVAPQYVRTARGVQHIDCGPPRVNGSSTAGDDPRGDPDEIAYNDSIQLWQKQLEGMFRDRIDRESSLQEYMIDRLGFFDALRQHLKNFPSRVPRSDSGILPATMRVRENRDIERMKAVLRARLNDLKDNRRLTLTQLETAQKARDSDTSLFFDELYADSSVEDMRRELADYNLPSRKGGTSGVSPDTSLSSSSSTAASSEEGAGDDSTRAKRRKPRRARTYHGTADSQKSSSSSSATRRHTTVPKVGPNDEASSSIADDYNEQVEDRISKLPLRVGSKARRAATDLILENVAMRIENNKLRSEIALQDLHIASLRVKKTPMVETTEKLESLRQKHEEIQTQERDFRRQFERQMDELNRRREQMDRREAELDEREMQLKAFAEAAASNFNVQQSDPVHEVNGVVEGATKNEDPHVFSQSHPHYGGHHHHGGHGQRHSSQQQHHYYSGGGSSNVIPLANRPMTNLYGKLTNFRSGTAIHDLNAVSPTSSRPNNAADNVDRQTLGGKSAKSPASELAQVPRHLAVKTETKPINEKRKKK